MELSIALAEYDTAYPRNESSQGLAPVLIGNDCDFHESGKCDHLINWNQKTKTYTFSIRAFLDERRKESEKAGTQSNLSPAEDI